jgi:hypothetical protein
MNNNLTDFGIPLPYERACALLAALGDPPALGLRPSHVTTEGLQGVIAHPSLHRQGHTQLTFFGPDGPVLDQLFSSIQSAVATALTMGMQPVAPDEFDRLALSWALPDGTRESVV